MKTTTIAATAAAANEEVVVYSGWSEQSTQIVMSLLAVGAAKLKRYTTLDKGTTWIECGSTDFTDNSDGTYTKSLVVDLVQIPGWQRFTVKSTGNSNTIAGQTSVGSLYLE